MVKKRSIILGVTGSIAAVKAPEIVRELMDNDCEVDCVLTDAAEQFVTPLSLATLSGRPVHSKMFSADAFHMPHLALARKADLLLIAPASASGLASLAHGTADDLISLIYLTTRAPILIAPAMHDTMWDHPAVQANVETLKKRNANFIGPVNGKLADNQKAMGRMAEPADIVKAALRLIK